MSNFRDKIKEIDKLTKGELTDDEVIALEILLIDVITEDVRIRCEYDFYNYLLSNPSPPNLEGISNTFKPFEAQ